MFLCPENVQNSWLGRSKACFLSRKLAKFLTTLYSHQMGLAPLHIFHYAIVTSCLLGHTRKQGWTRFRRCSPISLNSQKWERAQVYK